MFSSLLDPRARSINLLERFFSLSIAFISVFQIVSELWNTSLSESLASRRSAVDGINGMEKRKKTPKVKEKVRKRDIMFIERFSERRQPRVQQISQTGRHFDTCRGGLFQPNALQKWHANCLGVCMSFCAHHSRVIETTHWHWLCLLHFPALLLWSTRWDETPVSRPAFFVCSIVSRNGKRWPEVDERLEGRLW